MNVDQLTPFTKWFSFDQLQWFFKRGVSQHQQWVLVKTRVITLRDSETIHGRGKRLPSTAEPVESDSQELSKSHACWVNDDYSMVIDYLMGRLTHWLPSKTGWVKGFQAVLMSAGADLEPALQPQWLKGV